MNRHLDQNMIKLFRKEFVKESKNLGYSIMKKWKPVMKIGDADTYLKYKNGNIPITLYTRIPKDKYNEIIKKGFVTYVPEFFRHPFIPNVTDTDMILVCMCNEEDDVNDAIQRKNIIIVGKFIEINIQFIEQFNKTHNITHRKNKNILTSDKALQMIKNNQDKKYELVYHGTPFYKYHFVLSNNYRNRKELKLYKKEYQQDTAVNHFTYNLGYAYNWSRVINPSPSPESKTLSHDAYINKLYLPEDDDIFRRHILVNIINVSNEFPEDISYNHPDVLKMKQYDVFVSQDEVSTVDNKNIYIIGEIVSFETR